MSKATNKPTNDPAEMQGSGIGKVSLARNYDHRRKNLSPTTKYVLLMLATHCGDSNDFTFVGETRLSMECGFKDPKTVGEHLRLLERAGLIVKSDPGFGPRRKTLDWGEIIAGQLPVDIVADLPEIKVDDSAEEAAQAERDASNDLFIKQLPSPLPQWLTKLDGQHTCMLTGQVSNDAGMIYLGTVNSIIGTLKNYGGTDFKEFQTINAELAFRRSFMRVLAKRKLSQEQFIKTFIANSNYELIYERAEEIGLLGTFCELLDGKLSPATPPTATPRPTSKLVVDIGEPDDDEEITEL